MNFYKMSQDINLMKQKEQQMKSYLEEQLVNTPLNINKVTALYMPFSRQWYKKKLT